MTVSTTNLKDQYWGDGINPNFPVTAQFQNASELLVVVLDVDGVTEIPRTIVTHYTVLGGAGSTGVVIFTPGNIPTGTGAPGSQKVTIARNMPLTQATDLTPNDPFPADTVERSLGDRLIMIVQGQQEKINRSIQLLFSSSLTSAPALIDPVANATLIFDATGTKIISGPSTSSISSSVAAAAASAAAALDAYNDAVAAIGTLFQAYDADLTAIAALTSAANKLAYATGAGTWAMADFTAAGRALMDDADAAAQRVTLGLVIGTNVQAYDAELAAIAGLTSAADRLPYFTGSGTAALATFTAAGRALIDDADAAAQRVTLGLGMYSSAGILAVNDLFLDAGTGAGRLFYNVVGGVGSSWGVEQTDGTSYNLITLDITGFSITIDEGYIALLANNGYFTTTTNALATSATKGDLFIPTCNGVPTGVPAILPHGAAVCIRYNTAANALYAYANSAWRPV